MVRISLLIRLEIGRSFSPFKWMMFSVDSYILRWVFYKWISGQTGLEFFPMYKRPPKLDCESPSGTNFWTVYQWRMHNYALTSRRAYHRLSQTRIWAFSFESFNAMNALLYIMASHECQIHFSGGSLGHQREHGALLAFKRAPVQSSKAKHIAKLHIEPNLIF